MADDEQRIRQLAYRIWDSEGRPEGQQQRHWDMAAKIVAAERASGNEARVEEVGETHDEAPILEEELPLEEDETGIEENRLPLDDPEAEALPEEAPYRDDVVAEDDVPVQDRGETDPSTLAPLPEESATATRTRQPRRTDDTVTPPDATDTAQVPGKTAATRSRSGSTRRTAADTTPGKSTAKNTSRSASKSTAKKSSTKAAAGKTTTEKSAATRADRPPTKTATRSSTPRKPKK